MSIDLSNPKHRLWFIMVFLVVSAIIFTTIGYYGGKNIYEAKVDSSPSPTPTVSASPTATVTTSTVSKTSTEIEKLRQEKADLQKELDEKNNELSSKDAGISAALAYNTFLEYITQVIDAHDGFINWTDGEYQVAREKATATGNNSFVSAVDSAWNDHDGDPTSRIVNVYRLIVSGINGGLNN